MHLCDFSRLGLPKESRFVAMRESRLPDGIKFSADQVVADSIPVITEAADSDKTRQLKPDVVEKIDISESLKPLSLSTQDGSQAINPNQDNQSLQVLHEPLKVTASGNTRKSITEEKSDQLQVLLLFDFSLILALVQKVTSFSNLLGSMVSIIYHMDSGSLKLCGTDVCNLLLLCDCTEL
ncbi:hypothetical protein L2E82_15680 [Cichorium intybus]|uniref:Uncharacterized protein n=1 Tax=Cichorium intybus TaxID=13427 RepID=A0ACB9F3W6_CICIN|nr:hypothetical protein L2E82_15680 [Cichorium intybus]